MSNHNTLRERIRSRELVVGMWMHIPHPVVAEVMAQTGIDFILADGEHGPIPPAALSAILPATDLYDMPVIYRVPWNRIEYIKASLDSGVAGIMVPMVNSATEAEAVIAGAKYPPAGKRGIGAWRASDYYQNEVAYRKQADQQSVVVVQIETQQSVNDIGDIAPVNGVDVVYIGPGDLSLSLGVEPGALHPELMSACARVAEAARRNDIAAGVDIVSMDHVAAFKELGFSFFTYGADFACILDGGKAIAGNPLFA